MSTLNDLARQYFDAQGYTGDWNRQFVQFLQAGGATSENLMEAQQEYLAANIVGTATGNVTDDWMAYLGEQGHTGARGDRELQFWTALVGALP